MTMSDDSCWHPQLDVAVPRTPHVDAVRRAAFSVLRTGTTPRLASLAAVTGQEIDQVRDVVAQLVTAGIATIEGDLADDPAVVGAEGLTVRATAHALILDGEALHTWCAFDTIGIPAALGVDAVARTSCPSCGAPIELVLEGGQPPESTAVGWWPLETSGPVNESFCPTANLFCDRSHLDSWRASPVGGTRAGEALPLTALAARGRAMWALLTEPGGSR